MAPEQASGDEVDHRADLWSTGAMLFHALAGEPPFDAENYNKLMLKLLSQQAPSLQELRPDLPEWLLRMVDIALRRDVEARWQSAAQMAAGLRNQGANIGALDWDESYEDATTRTASPFSEQESLAPPPGLASLSEGARPLPPMPAPGAPTGLPQPAQPPPHPFPSPGEKAQSGPRPVKAEPFVAPPGASSAAPASWTEETDHLRATFRPSASGISIKLFIAGIAVGAITALVIGTAIAFFLTR